MQPLIKRLLTLFLCFAAFSSQALTIKSDEQNTMDRVHLVQQQINLLQNRLNQSGHELNDLQQKHDTQLKGISAEKISKSHLDKALLDISVSKSNLDSVNIELTDAQQTIAWLEKSIQEIENQINVLNIFGRTIAADDINHSRELRTDADYQQSLLKLEKERYALLKKLQLTAKSILTLRTDTYNLLNTLLKSQNLLFIKQQQVKDELAWQEQQSDWLQRLNGYYAELTSLDPVKEKAEYAALEREIYYANEWANYAYVMALVARYDDQIQQMKLSVIRSSSISVLNQISDQYQTLIKQVDKLNDVLKSRIVVLDEHISYLSKRKKNNAEFQLYLENLSQVSGNYKSAATDIVRIQKTLTDFRQALDKAMQIELSSRQGLPVFGMRTLLDIGKEILLVPALAFQLLKSLPHSIVRGCVTTSALAWTFYAVLDAVLLFSCFFLHSLLTQLLARPSKWRDKMNSKWLSLQWLKRNLADLFVIGNLIGCMAIFGITGQQYLFIFYLAIVWLVFKSIITLARLCLVETTHDTIGKDTKLYHRLKWIILIGGVITALTVFVHQLPLIYELKALCDRLFLILLMVASLFLLRSYDVVPNLILSHMESNHPYLRKSICLIGILIPLLMLGNSIIGIFGYLNLIMTVSWYEGLFLIVLIGYLIVRGLMSDGLEQISRLMIQYVKNGWLWTEAFLKPLDKILRVSLFLLAWGVLFILYGWDKQSPIVSRLNSILHYQLANILHTTITPLSIIELCLVISVFYWTAKWTREFVYRLLLSRTKDMGIRNSIAVISQYTVIVLGGLFCLRVLGINLNTLGFIASMFAFGIGLGLRDLANNFASGFLLLLERPLRVGDIVSVNGLEGDVTHIGGRAVTIRTWDHMELVVPNAEIFNKAFTNWTAKDNIVRSVLSIKIGRHDNPHEVRVIIQDVLAAHKDVLNDPQPEVFVKEMNDTLMEFEIRYFVNIRQVKSRMSVISSVLMQIWDAFEKEGIKPPYPQQEILLRSEKPAMEVVPIKTDISG
jgi:potassium efflux system protein